MATSMPLLSPNEIRQTGANIMNKRNAVVGAGASLVLLLLAAWWLGWFNREDDLIAEIKQIASQPEAQQNPDVMRDAMRKQFEGVPPEQRMQMFEQLAPVIVPLMMARMTADINQLLALPEDQRIREIDKKIDEMARGGGPPRAPGRGNGGGPPNVDPKRMGEMQKKMLDWTTPEQRTTMQLGMKMFAERMTQRGMEPPPMPGGGFF
jgi:hypothetical protein